jgi:hypothetical protein
VNPPFAWCIEMRGSPPMARGGAPHMYPRGAESAAFAPRDGAGTTFADIADCVLGDELIGSDAPKREWLWPVAAKRRVA